MENLKCTPLLIAIVLSAIMHTLLILYTVQTKPLLISNKTKTMQLQLLVHPHQGTKQNQNSDSISKLDQRKSTQHTKNTKTSVKHNKQKAAKIITTIQTKQINVEKENKQNLTDIKSFKQASAKSNQHPSLVQTSVIKKDGDTRPPLYGLGSPKNPIPNYPYRAKKRGLQGKVILNVKINREGLVESIRIKQSTGHSILDNAARNTVATWTFEPALRHGKKVISEIEIPISFKLTD